MTSEEYVQIINELMALQDKQVNWIFAILSILIGLAAFYQWRTSEKDKEMLRKEINEMKTDIINEYQTELKEALIEIEEKNLETTTELVFESIESVLSSNDKALFLSIRIDGLLDSIRNIEKLKDVQILKLYRVIYYILNTFVREVTEDETEDETSKPDKPETNYIFGTIHLIQNFIENKSHPTTLADNNYHEVVDFIKSVEKRYL